MGIYAHKVILFVMKRNPSQPGSFDEVTGLCWGGKIVKLLAKKNSATNCVLIIFVQLRWWVKSALLLLSQCLYIYIYILKFVFALFNFPVNQFFQSWKLSYMICYFLFWLDLICVLFCYGHHNLILDHIYYSLAYTWISFYVPFSFVIS